MDSYSCATIASPRPFAPHFHVAKTRTDCVLLQGYTSFVDTRTSRTKSVKGAMFYEYPTIHHQHSPGYPGRLARTLSPHALARRSGGSRLGLWHERRVSEGAGGLLAAHVRLASTGGEAQSVCAVSCRHRWRR